MYLNFSKDVPLPPPPGCRGFFSKNVAVKSCSIFCLKYTCK